MFVVPHSWLSMICWGTIWSWSRKKKLLECPTPALDIVHNQKHNWPTAAFISRKLPRASLEMGCLVQSKLISSGSFEHSEFHNHLASWEIYNKLLGRLLGKIPSHWENENKTQSNFVSCFLWGGQGLNLACKRRAHAIEPHALWHLWNPHYLYRRDKSC